MDPVPNLPDDNDSTISRRPVVAEKRSLNRRQSNVRIFFGSVLVIAILYAMRQVFVPIALAILFAFLLRPIVGILERTFLRRSGAIVLSLGIAITLLGLSSWYLALQFTGLAKEVSRYSGNIEKKFRLFRPSPSGPIAMVEKTLQRVAESTEKTERADMKVRVIPEKRTLPERYENLAPSIELIASAFLVIVLVFFLLKDREELRDKVLRLAGRAHLTVTTQAIGETAHRISRYLLTVALLNVGFGVLIGIGLFLMKVPHALLWGVLAALLRFVPYIGAVLSAALPTFLALAVFPSWLVPLGVLLLFLITDQILAGFVEPLVVGHRVGVSPIALLVAAIFWGWLWGPVGLLLATPITVCLTVAGEFIPAMQVFSILFGTEAPLEGYLTFYNRLIMRDRVGAIAIADRYSESSSMEATFTELFIPTLTFAAEEFAQKKIPTAVDHFIKDLTREMIVRLGDRNAVPGETDRHLLAVSVASERLSLGTLMIIQLMRAKGFAFDTFTDLPDPEIVDFIREVGPDAVFVSCSNPLNTERGYGLLQLISSQFRELILVAGGSGFAREPQKALAAGASYVPASLAETTEEILRQIKKGRRKTRL